MNVKKLDKYLIKENVVMKNRFVLAPMTTYSSNENLTLSIEEEKYYEQRGKEFGMVITAATAVSRQAQAFTHQISAMDRSYLPSLKRLSEAIKKGGALAVLQLHHGGRMNAQGLFEGQDIVSASSVKAERSHAIKPRALETEEVYQIIEDFKNAMILAIDAGFDGIELHGANTYLIQQFFSPHSNRREDEFGGSLEKRMTFPLKLVEMAIKTRQTYATENFIIGYRLSPEEYENPGITLDDTKELVSALSKTDIDYIHFSLGSYKQSSIRNESDKEPIISVLKTHNVGLKPLIGVGGIESKADALDALSMGFDMVAIGKAALSDQNVVSHIMEEQPIKKVIDDSSVLPRPMKERIKGWSYLQSSGYTVK
jgi:2,4-dienoyl-CoA reductase-like NADH-dependent reductase (Old Yellow Enzyme family)